jgi:hypothetical protein
MDRLKGDLPNATQRSAVPFANGVRAVPHRTVVHCGLDGTMHISSAKAECLIRHTWGSLVFQIVTSASCGNSLLHLRDRRGLPDAL